MRCGCGAPLIPKAEGVRPPKFCPDCREERKRAQARERYHRGRLTEPDYAATNRRVARVESVLAAVPLPPEPGPIEQAVVAELAALGGPAVGSSLADVVKLLARRLDMDPHDREIAPIVREFRQVLGILRELAGTAPSELDAFLAGIATESFR